MTDRSHRDSGTPFEALSDDELLAAVRAGDIGAYSALYHRHLGAALTQARRVGGPDDPQDVAQEAFLKILKTIMGGGGPRQGFVAYLMRAVRNEAVDRHRRAREVAVEDVEMVDAARAGVSDGVDERLDQDLMQQAFGTLPEAWQQVLWLTEVEGLPPRAVAPQLQQSPNAVAQLSRRAREGLRTAWLQAHVDVASAQEACRQTAGMLGAFERGQLSASRAARVQTHLEGCVRCSVALSELREVSTRLRGLLLPLVLGSPLLLGTLSEVLAVPGAGAALGAGQDGAGQDGAGQDGTGAEGSGDSGAGDSSGADASGGPSGADGSGSSGGAGSSGGPGGPSGPGDAGGAGGAMGGPTGAGSVPDPSAMAHLVGGATSATQVAGTGLQAGTGLAWLKVSTAAVHGWTVVAAGSAAAAVVGGVVLAGQLPLEEDGADHARPSAASPGWGQGAANLAAPRPPATPTQLPDVPEQVDPPTTVLPSQPAHGAATLPVSLVEPQLGPAPEASEMPEPSGMQVELGGQEPEPVTSPEASEPSEPFESPKDEAQRPLPPSLPQTEDPTEPEQPTEPGPTEPSDPEPTPTEPTEPAEPAPTEPAPEQPTTSPSTPNPEPEEPSTPVEPTEPPEQPEETEPPAEPEEMEPPVEPSEPPTEPSEPPTEPTDPPVEPTDPPVEPSEPPTEPTEPPTEATEPPVEPTEPPVEPTDPPVEPTDPPVEPTEPPVEPTEPPVEPTDPPVEPTDPPTEPTEPPVDPEEPGASTPSMQSPAGGERLVPVTLRGEGTPGALIRILDDAGDETATTTVGEDGTWSVSPTPGAPDVATRYRAVQEVDGTTSEVGERTDEYVFLAPALLSPTPGTTISPSTSSDGWGVAVFRLQISVPERQDYALIIDGRRWDLSAPWSGATANYTALLGRGTHTIDLAYRNPTTGQLGAVRSATLTVR